MVATVRVLAQDPGWRDRAACKGADLALFVPTGKDPQFPPDAATDYCNRCEVRPDCLADALARRDSIGCWGGTSTYQRKQLRRRQNRRSCPACTATMLCPTPGGETCVACGMSWPVKPEVAAGSPEASSGHAPA